MFHTKSNTAFFPRPARRHCAPLACIFVSCWLGLTPVRTNADTPPGAPAGTHIMLYTSGVPQDVTAQYHIPNDGYGGYITPANGQPAIYVTFNYTTGQVINTSTGADIGYLQYPAK